ncbi:MAG: 3-deoxy-7-phosphoheptulonate synthase [Gammaproteobacteria bacterium]|nr:3-deoxy-7-phosphoheptulonate synthase [Gammaproteobacteria bacterium]
MNLSTDCKLVKKKNCEDATKIKIGETVIGQDFAIIAGPCSVEDEVTTLKIAEEIAVLDIKFFRAGAFKPRNSPYSFQGYGDKALNILSKVKSVSGLKIVTEVLDNDAFDAICDVADIVQVGAKNMGNTALLKKLGGINKPVLLKRGFAAKIEEFLLAAEYILSNGNKNIILCERGIRTFDDFTRFTFDVAAIPTLKSFAHLPVFADPSHATGLRELVTPMAKAAVVAGADGLLIEAHIDPDKALSDSRQTINIDELKNINNKVKALLAFR